MYDTLYDFISFLLFTLGKEIPWTLIAIAGSLFGVWIGCAMSRKSIREATNASYQNAIDLMRRQEFYREASIFRDAFINEQRLLTIGSFIEKTNRLTVQKIVADAINRHEIAMLRFKPFVCKNRAEDYEKAWKEYAGNSRHFEQYSGHALSGSDDLALGRIEKLLEFASFKH